MTGLGIAGVAGLILFLISLRSARLAAGVELLPMQWSFDGKPTWFARRAVALYLVPTIAAGVMLLSALGTMDARNTTQALIVGLIGIGSVQAQAFYSWRLASWLRERPSV